MVRTRQQDHWNTGGNEIHQFIPGVPDQPEQQDPTSYIKSVKTEPSLSKTIQRAGVKKEGNTVGNYDLVNHHASSLMHNTLFVSGPF